MSSHVKFCPGCGQEGTVKDYPSGGDHFPAYKGDPPLVVAADFNNDRLVGYDLSINHYRCTQCAINFYVSDINFGL